MALLKYFKKSSLLPNPNGPLSERMPSSSIVSANKEVENLLDGDKKPTRGQYTKCSDEEKAKVAKRASEMGVTQARYDFSKRSFLIVL